MKMLSLLFVLVFSGCTVYQSPAVPIAEPIGMGYGGYPGYYGYGGYGYGVGGYGYGYGVGGLGININKESVNNYSVNNGNTNVSGNVARGAGYMQPQMHMSSGMHGGGHR